MPLGNENPGAGGAGAKGISLNLPSLNSQTGARKQDRATYTLVLRPLPGADDTSHAVRALLKIALRRFQMRCVSIIQGAARMTARIIKFPPRAILVSEAPEDGWFVNVAAMAARRSPFRRCGRALAFPQLRAPRARAVARQLQQLDRRS